MSRVNCFVSGLLLMAFMLAACQPVMPIETAEPATVEEAPPDYPDLPGEILIPAGPFQMGCDTSNLKDSCRETELPLHTVNLDAYYIDQFEVTNARYQACVDAGVCTPPKRMTSVTRDSYYDNSDFGDYPVSNVDWTQARDFCAWEAKRLPTEAEWVKAARGDQDTRKYPWGDEDPTCELANYWGRTSGCAGDTVSVGSHPAGASSYGVMDMAGNVREWVNDWYARDYFSESPSDNPQGPKSGNERVYLGGSFSSPDSQLRAASRDSDIPHAYYDGVGFRCVHSP